MKTGRRGRRSPHSEAHRGRVRWHRSLRTKATRLAASYKHRVYTRGAGNGIIGVAIASQPVSQPGTPVAIPSTAWIGSNPGIGAPFTYVGVHAIKKRKLTTKKRPGYTLDIVCPCCTLYSVSLPLLDKELGGTTESLTESGKAQYFLRSHGEPVWYLSCSTPHRRPARTWLVPPTPYGWYSKGHCFRSQAA